jgi:hypothetical protein
MRSRFGIVLVITLWLGTMPAVLAHHSVAGQFDSSKPMTLKGVITKVDWMNPHSYIYLDVKEPDGTTTTWALSTLPTAMLRRAGLTKESLLGTGKEIVMIDAIPARDGTKHLGYISKITYADGHFYQLSGD